MRYLLLLCVVVTLSLGNVLKKQYDLKSAHANVIFFTGVTSLAASFFFFASAGFDLIWDRALVPYSALFALFYLATSLGSFFTIRYATVSAAALTISYSLLMPTMYGVLFLHEPFRLTCIGGLLVLLASMFLVYVQKGAMKLSGKAIAAMAVTFVGNGLAGVMQKMQQVRFEGAMKNEFMGYALLAAGICFVAIALFGKAPVDLRCSLLHGIPSGISNGIANLLILILTGMIPNTILYPSVSAGSIIMGCLLSVLLYRERPNRRQLAGYILGAVAAVLLNL